LPPKRELIGKPLELFFPWEPHKFLFQQKGVVKDNGGPFPSNMLRMELFRMDNQERLVTSSFL